MAGIWHPSRIHWARDAVNGAYPAVQLYGRAVENQNYLMRRQGKQWFTRSWRAGVGTGGAGATTEKARFRRSSSIGATRLQAILRLGRTLATGAPSPPNPYVQLDVTEVGVGTTSIGPIYYGLTGGAVTDAPSELFIALREIDITPNADYECLLKCVDFGRILSLCVREISDGNIDPATDYFNGFVAQADAPIFDATPHERLLKGLSEMWRANGGTGVDWAREDGSARTRSGGGGGTYANLYDGSTTGTPTNATRGFHLDNTYRRSKSKTTVPYVLAAYGAMSTGGGVQGNVKIMDTSGNSYGPVVITNNLPGWFSTTVNLPADARKYDLQFASNGIHTLSVYAVSLYELDA